MPKPSARLTLIGFIVVLASAALVLHLLSRSGLKQTAALFIGLPTLIAIGLTLLPNPESATGMILKGMTIAIAMSGIVLGEGVVCIVFASPLFLGIGALIGSAIDNQRWRERELARRRGDPERLLLVAIPLLLLSLEGTLPALSWPRDNTVTVSRVAVITATTFERNLTNPPHFGPALPPFFRLGFPSPVEATGIGLEPGAERAVWFQVGSNPRRPLHLRVNERQPQRVTFAITADQTPIAGWLTWREAEVVWRAVDEAHTQIDWIFRYDRQLDPSWYFGPLEQYGVWLAAEYLVDTYTAPNPDNRSD